MDAVHDAPVWRDRANLVIGAPLREEGRAEQLWVRRVSDQRFEICCIPFFLYDLALGDFVETDANYDLVRVVERSGRFVFRVWFGQALRTRQEVADKLGELGALLEWSSASLLAIDAAEEAHAQAIADYLAEQETAIGLMFETGRT